MTDDFNLIWLILGVDLKFFSSTIFAIFQQKMHVFACCKKNQHAANFAIKNGSIGLRSEPKNT